MGGVWHHSGGNGLVFVGAPISCWVEHRTRIVPSLFYSFNFFGVEWSVSVAFLPLAPPWGKVYGIHMLPREYVSEWMGYFGPLDNVKTVWLQLLIFVHCMSIV